MPAAVEAASPVEAAMAAVEVTAEVEEVAADDAFTLADRFWWE